MSLCSTHRVSPSLCLCKRCRTLAVSLPSADDAVNEKKCDCHERFDMRAQGSSHVGNHRVASEFGLDDHPQLLRYPCEVASCEHITGQCSDLQFVFW